MDNLKKYLGSKRNELNHHEPPPGVWEYISNEFTVIQNVKSKQYTSWLLAASFILIAGIGAITYLFIFRNTDKIITNSSNLHTESLNIKGKTIMTPPVIKISMDSAVNRKKWTSSNASKNSHTINKMNQLVPPVEQMQTSYTTVIDDQKKVLKKLPIYAERAEYFAEYKKQFIDLEAEESLMKVKLQSQERPDFFLTD